MKRKNSEMESRIEDLFDQTGGDCGKTNQMMRFILFWFELSAFYDECFRNEKKACKNISSLDIL